MIRRRVTAVLTVVLSVQLWLVGASPLCRAGHGPARGPEASPAAGHVAHAAHAPGTPVPAPDDGSRHQGGAGCALAAMCAVVMVAAPGEPVPAAVTAAESAVPAVAGRWASVTRAPELPPPRG